MSRRPASPAGRRRGDPLAERERQHEPLVVVGVLAHQVGPPRGQPHAVRLPAEPLPEQRRRPHRGDRAWVNRQASAAMALRSRDARQPSSDWIFADEATSTAGSPARRGPDLDGDVDAGDLAAHLDHLADREAGPVAQVVDAVLAGTGGPQRAQVRVGQVGDVDVVPDAGPVRGRVVVAEDLHRPALGRAGQHVRDEMGLRVVPLAQPPAVRALESARHVEVAQADRAEPVQPAELASASCPPRSWTRRRGWSGASGRSRGSASARARRRPPRWRRRRSSGHRSRASPRAARSSRPGCSTSTWPGSPPTRRPATWPRSGAPPRCRRRVPRRRSRAACP